MNKIVLTLAYILLLSLVVGLGVYFYLRLDKIELTLDEINNSAFANTLPINNAGNNIVNLNSTGSVTEPVSPSPSQSEKPTSQTGPSELMAHDTYTTTSESHVGFAPAVEPILESASVPEVVKLRNGDLLLYFVDAAALQLGYSRSTDDGAHWSERQLITITSKEDVGAAVDPSVIQLADGTLRMYFYGSYPTQGDPAFATGEHAVYSAISSDGINWIVEDGERFAAERLTDPEVLQLDANNWVMYYSLGTTTGIATSTDGLTFVDTKERWTGGGVPGAYVDKNDVVHLYGCSPNGLNTASSNDGVAFPAETESVFTTTVGGVCDPSPVLIDDEEVLLVYKQVNP